MTDEPEIELSDRSEALIVAQRRRQRAYEEGVYELAEDEGFNCSECDWHELNAPVNDTIFEVDSEERDDDGLPPLCVCGNCGAPVDTDGDRHPREFLVEFLDDEWDVDDLVRFEDHDD